MSTTTTWTLPSTLAVGDLVSPAILTEAWMDAVLSDLYRLGGAAGTNAVRVGKTADQSTPNGSLVTLTWDVENSDTNTLHDNAINNSLLYVRESGIYLTMATITWDFNATGTRGAYFIRSTTIVNGICEVPASTFTHTGLTIVSQQRLGAGEYMQVQAFQDSGGSLLVLKDYSHFGMFRIGEF